VERTQKKEGRSKIWPLPRRTGQRARLLDSRSRQGVPVERGVVPGSIPAGGRRGSRGGGVGEDGPLARGLDKKGVTASDVAQGCESLPRAVAYAAPPTAIKDNVLRRWCPVPGDEVRATGVRQELIDLLRDLRLCPFFSKNSVMSS
jgi:hypothetical protein